MTLGLAIVIAAIIYAINSNHSWPQTWRIFKKTFIVTAVLAALAAVGFGIWFSVRVRQQSASKPAFDPNAPYQSASPPPQQSPSGGSFFQGVGAVPAVPGQGPIDCYDSHGKLLPNWFAPSGGVTIGCGSGQTAKPISERAHVPPAQLHHVERIEACEKREFADPKSTPAKYQACVETK